MFKKGIIISVILIFVGGVSNYSPNLILAASKEKFLSKEKQARVYPFITSQKIPSWGEIVGSKEGAVNLTLGDMVYAKIEPSKKVKPGDQFLIGRYLEPIFHPKNKKEMGYLVVIPGELTILGGEGNIVSAKIHKSSQPILYGDKIYLFPLLPAEETSIRLNKKIEGLIISSLAQTENITSREYIFIDQGSQHGVILGTIFKVYQTGYFTDKIQKEEGKQLLKFKVGEAVVVSVQKESSTALVINSSQAIYPGDEVVSQAE